MTPEERRKEVEYTVKMAEQGILAAPAYDREEWRIRTEDGHPDTSAPTAAE
jgi:hypothetical protein